jgi:hypothetical protein
MLIFGVGNYRKEIGCSLGVLLEEQLWYVLASAQ